MRTLIILLVLAGTGYFLHKRYDRYSAYDSLVTEAKSKETLASQKQIQVKNLEDKVAPLREGEQELAKPDGSPEKLQTDVLSLRDALTAGAAKLDSAEDDYLAAVNDVRDFAKTQTFPSLKLPNGEEIKNCKITKFGEGYIQILHDEGSAKLQSEDLPEGWADRFAVDYVSRHSREENAELAKKVQEEVLSPLDLKKAKLSEIDERLRAVNEQLMAFSGNIRESRRQADKMVRDAYKLPLDSDRGHVSANKRETLFKKAKEIEAAREGTRLKYMELRKQKEALERQRLIIKKAPLNPQPASQP